MSFAAYWEKTKRQIKRNRNAFEFRVYGAGYCNFIIYNFYFIIPKAKMRIVKITRTDGSSSGINYIANSFGVFTYHRSEEHTSELQSQSNLVCRLLLEKKKKKKKNK